MSHFIRAIREYMAIDVIDAEWRKMNIRMRRANTTTEIQEIHQEYVSRVHTGCFRSMSSYDTTIDEDKSTIDPSSSSSAVASISSSSGLSMVASSIDKILQCIVDFHQRWTNINNKTDTQSQLEWDRLMAEHERFRNYLQFMINVMQHQANTTSNQSNGNTTGVLLQRIDFNGFYSQHAARQTK